MGAAEDGVMSIFVKTKRTLFWNFKIDMQEKKSCDMQVDIIRSLQTFPIKAAGALLLYKTFIQFIFTKQHVHHVKVDSRWNKRGRFY